MNIDFEFAKWLKDLLLNVERYVEFYVEVFISKWLVFHGVL